MSLLDPMKSRLTRDLEPILSLPDPRTKLSAYHDMPYAIFRYDPEEEFELRREVGMLETRLTQDGKRVIRISLAECLDQAMRSQQPLEDWFKAEREMGTETVVETVHTVLSEYAPLVELVAERLPDDAGPDARRRLHHADRCPLPGVPDLLAAGAAEGPDRGARRPLLPGRARRRLGPAVHGRARGRAQLPSQDLLSRSPRDGGHAAIRTLFASDIERRIEEVIKVDQTDEEILREEIGEYVTTDAIRSHYVSVLEAYAETPNKPHEGVGVWVSGFFGSGKSSFAKMLGLSIQNRDPGRASPPRSASRSAPATTS